MHLVDDEPTAEEETQDHQKTEAEGKGVIGLLFDVTFLFRAHLKRLIAVCCISGAHLGPPLDPALRRRGSAALPFLRIIGHVGSHFSASRSGGDIAIPLHCRACSAILSRRRRALGGSEDACPKGIAMHLSNESLIVILLVGLVAGWLAGQIMQGTGFGLIGDLIIGIVGAFIGDWLMPQLHIHFGAGILGLIVNATIGAIVLLLIIGLVRGSGRGWGRRRRW